MIKFPEELLRFSNLFILLSICPIINSYIVMIVYRLLELLIEHIYPFQVSVNASKICVSMISLVVGSNALIIPVINFIKSFGFVGIITAFKNLL
jgi:hypothetical protein